MDKSSLALRRKSNILFAACVFSLLTNVGVAQTKASPFPKKGNLILTGGSFTSEGIKAFVELAGGADANFVFIPSASSGIKLESGYIWEPRDSTKEKMDSFSLELAKMFGVKKIIVLHTTSTVEANSKKFCEPLKKANAVWFGPGNAGRYASIFLGSRFQKELDTLLMRGGTIAGNSAGSIIQGSYIVRGRPDKPVLMAKGKEQGFGFIKNFVINPHLISAKRETELINVLDWHPELIGFGVDDETTLIVKNGIIQMIGNGPVYIYDNKLHDKKWWYELPPGKKFSLTERKIID
jgi:cyanophycinase